MKNILSNIINSKKIYIIFALFICLIFSLRIINLDSDLPPWGIVNYQPIDEGSYSILALNKINHGEMNPSISDFNIEVYTPPHVRVNVIGNGISYLSMRLLGDNYYGYRMVSIICSLAIFILIYLTLKELTKYYAEHSIKRKWFILMIMLFLATDFTFLVASRVVEPSIVRAFMNILAVYFYIKLRDKDKLRYFSLGIISTLSILFVYITNVFIYIPCGLVLLLYLLEKKYKTFFMNSAFFLLGVGVAILIVEPYYRIVWDTSGIANMFSAIKDFSSVSGYETSNAIKGYFKNIVMFLSSNIFLYNPLLLAASLISLVVNLYNAIKQKNEILLFSVTAIIGLLLQTLYSQDYIIRKIIVIYPVLIVNIFLMSFYIKDIIEKIIGIKEKNKRIKLKISSLVLLLIVTSITICAISFRMFIFSDGTINDFERIDKLLIIVLGISSVLIIIICQVINLFKKAFNENLNLTFLFISIIISLSLSLYMSIKYVYINPTFTEKQVMVELGKVAKDNYVLGEYENGFALYNDIKPVLNTYSKIGEFIEEDGVEYYFDYYFNPSIEGEKNFIDNVVFQNSEYTVYPIKVFERNFTTFGVSRSMALYKKVKK
ncbi:hypothetical protein UT300007_02190 [Clostridium sp. CTA-7]